MSIARAPSSFSIGWDVGGWNCDKNGKSRDAIVILDKTLTIFGKPWRGNLRDCIVAATTSSDWLKALFEKCGVVFPADSVTVTMAIDTPLGFPDQFVDLITGQSFVEPDATSGRNRYLFRQTERHLFERGLAPLSAIKDMIGSQATKGMHVLAKFAPNVESCGVWTDGHGFRAIETYPTACRKTKVVETLLNGHTPLGHEDKDDARVCAVVAHLFAAERHALEEPDDRVPKREGWIWVPRQAVTQARLPKDSHA
jgi:predicted nuclease with RNAse H fold